ncbi:MAG TPA: metallophosphoesterase family protein [Chloroflexota bacterium]|jgi:predicted phosphodiesterase
MKVGLISDIHANAVALEAVLADLGRERPDRLVCLGDLVGGGPQPREVIARVRGLGCPVVAGNVDVLVATFAPEAVAPLIAYFVRRGATEAAARRMVDINDWSAAHLAPEERTYLLQLQPTVTVELGEAAELLCFHGSPRSYDDDVVATTPEAELDALLAGAEATVLAGGHTHLPLLRRYGLSTVVNPGTVGVARAADARAGRKLPWAEYALVSWEDGRLGVDFRRVPFDAGALGAAARASGMPHADWFMQAYAP